MTLKHQAKMLIKDGLSLAHQVLGRPHNKTRSQLQATYRAFANQDLDTLRIKTLSAAFGMPEADVTAKIEQLRAQMPAVFDDAQRVQEWQALRTDMMGLRDRLSLGALMMVGGFATCVETGVGSGASATMILRQLQAQGAGRLISIDIQTPIAARYGENIPAALRSFWELRLQTDQALLPTVLKELGTLDFFLHDSRHVVQHMRWEYELVWPYLRSGGCLASHDIVMTTAFDDFGKKYHAEIAASGAIGSFGFYLKR